MGTRMVAQRLPCGPGQKCSLGGVQVPPSEYLPIVSGLLLVHVPEMPLHSSLDARKVGDPLLFHFISTKAFCRIGCVAQAHPKHCYRNNTFR